MQPSSHGTIEPQKGQIKSITLSEEGYNGSLFLLGRVDHRHDGEV